MPHPADDLNLDSEERALILHRRAAKGRFDGQMEGIGMAILRLDDWGRECCGGDGEAKNPETGERWGESYFKMAQMLSDWRAGLLQKGPIRDR